MSPLFALADELVWFLFCKTSTLFVSEALPHARSESEKKETHVSEAGARKRTNQHASTLAPEDAEAPATNSGSANHPQRTINLSSHKMPSRAITEA